MAPTPLLGHACKPWAQHERWTSWVAEEFYLLGDKEKALGYSSSVGISAMCDRDRDLNLPQMQLGFFDFVVLPLAEEMARVIPACAEAKLHEIAESNYQAWAIKASLVQAEETTAMVEEKATMVLDGAVEESV